jgi:hypothetical protein
MQRINFLMAIAITALIALASTPTLAQSSGAAELKKRILEQIAAGTRTQPVTNTTPVESVEAEAQTAAPFATQQGGILDVVERQKKALLGTWNLTLTFSDGSQAKSTLSVFPGRTDSEGSVLHSAEATLLLPNPTTSEQGAWQYTGGLQFIASYRGYAVDEKFEQPFGTIGFRHAITVSDNQDTFTGRATFEVIDSHGQVLFSDNVQTRGVRQRAVAP